MRRWCLVWALGAPLSIYAQTYRWDLGPQATKARGLHYFTVNGKSQAFRPLRSGDVVTKVATPNWAKGKQAKVKTWGVWYRRLSDGACFQLSEGSHADWMTIVPVPTKTPKTPVVATPPAAPPPTPVVPPPAPPEPAPAQPKVEEKDSVAEAPDATSESAVVRFTMAHTVQAAKDFEFQGQRVEAGKKYWAIGETQRHGRVGVILRPITARGDAFHNDASKDFFFPVTESDPDPENPDAPESPNPIPAFDPVSEVTRPLTAVDSEGKNFVFQKGARLAESGHTREYVSVYVVDDPLRREFRIAYKDYVLRDASNPANDFTKLIMGQNGYSTTRFSSDDPDALKKSQAAIDAAAQSTPETAAVEPEPDAVEASSTSGGHSQNWVPGAHRSPGIGVSTVKLSDPSTSAALCGKRAERGYGRTPFAFAQRKPYRGAILAAANELGISPALLEASADLEAIFDGRRENTVEKDSFMFKTTWVKRNGKKVAIKTPIRSEAQAAAHVMQTKNPAWGKGIGQVGPALAIDLSKDSTQMNINDPSDPNDDTKFTINWLAPRPSRVPPPDSYRKSYPDSVWIPEVAFEAKARDMKRKMTASRPISCKNKNRPSIDARSHLFGRGDAEAMRALLSFYNRGYRIMNSLHTYYCRHGRLPMDHGELWSTPPPQAGEDFGPLPYPKTTLLSSQPDNRRHVWNAVGLCGEVRQDSLYAHYAREYAMDDQGKWVSK